MSRNVFASANDLFVTQRDEGIDLCGAACGQARSPTLATQITTAAKVQGSTTDTPQTWLTRKRVSPKLRRTPMRIPAEIRLSPFLRIILNTASCCAPNAIRTPISCVRNDTVCLAKIRSTFEINKMQRGCVTCYKGTAGAVMGQTRLSVGTTHCSDCRVSGSWRNSCHY